MLTARACPSCDGKRYVSVLVDLPPDDAPREELSGKTWVRKAPLCDGKGRVSGDDSAAPSRANCAGIGRVPTFRQFSTRKPLPNCCTVKKRIMAQYLQIEEYATDFKRRNK